MVWFLPALLVAFAAGYGIACYLTAENLLATLWDEWRLRRLSLAAADAACAANPRHAGLIVSLTTIPGRIEMLAPTLKSLLRQTARPAEIRLCLPDWSVREQRAYAVPDWLRGLRCVTLVPCSDEGPATKYLPTLRAVPPDQPVVVLDDDRLYHPRLLECYAALVHDNPDEVISASGWNVPADLIDRPTTLWRRLTGEPFVPVRANQLRRPRRIDIVLGLHSYVVRPRFFDLPGLGDFSKAPPAVRYSDDVWICAHCRVPCIVYPLPLAYTDHKPWLGRGRINATSLSRNVNCAAADADRGNSIALRFFSDRWQRGNGRLARPARTGGR